MGRPTKYTPEFLRSLLAWESEACAMPGCRRPYAADVPGELPRYEWHVCGPCWVLLRQTLKSRRAHYDETRWLLERPADLMCFKCDERPGMFGFGSLSSWLTGKDPAFADMRACREHRYDAHLFMYDSWKAAERKELAGWCEALREHWAEMDKGWKQAAQKKRRTVNLLSLTMQLNEFWKTKEGIWVKERLHRLQPATGPQLSVRQLTSLALEKYDSACAS